jgi:signal transduction histidine kinase
MTQIIVTRQLEEEITLFLDNYWKKYLEGDLQTWSTYLTDDYKNIGGTEEEIWNSQKEIMDYTVAVIDQMVGTVEFRNKKTEVFSLAPYILAHEFFDMYIKIENDWVFYGKFRCSSIIKRNSEGWQVIHQHGSYPDSKTEQGEAFAFDKISTENRALKDAIKRRTVELENKSRELEIESALERVRAVALTMQNPSDMANVCRIISDQLEFLKVNNIRNIQTAIIYESKGTYINYEYYARHDKLLITEVNYKTHHLQEEFALQMLKGAGEFFQTSLKGQEVRDWYEYQKTTNQFADPFLEEAKTLNYYMFSLGPVALGISTYSPLIEEEINLFKRFRNVFELAYRRFLDIQKAENQAREAQIEAAIERVRAQSMAMHQPDDLDKVNKEILNQLTWLQVPGLTGVTFYLVDENGWVKAWDFSSPGNLGNPNSYTLQFDSKKYDLIGEPFRLLQQSDEDYFIMDFPIKKLVRVVKELDEINPFVANAFKAAMTIGKLTHQWSSCARLSDGILGIDLVNPPTEDTKTIVLKMAGAFNMAYQRFLDLQKAVAQALEAQIEAALEKVRGRAMAMHNSNDLSATASLVFTELRKLGINPLRCGVGLLVKGDHKAQLYSATSSAAGDSLSLVGWVELSGHPVLHGIYDSWLQQEDYFPELTGEQLKLYYEKLLSGLSLPSVPDWTKGEKQYGHFLTFSVASLYAWSYTPYDESEIKILKRFASVIDLTFRRYIELQKSEAQAREAIKASSLDRVRAEIASMRTADDLQRITPLIWHELIALGVPFVRCGVFIVNEVTTHVQAFLSAPDGHSLAALDLPFESSELTRNSVINWQKGQVYKTHWNKEEFLNWMQSMVRDGQVRNTETYQGASEPPESLDLHFVPFTQGMLYVGNILPLTNDELDLVKSLAEAFSIAYARYEDFKKLEIAKQSIETTLSDLKAAQSQLVQSEKMASLGELTAGIAHEIQNPLNFVNNFSEVSTELVEEMNEEMSNGNMEAAKEIAGDLRQNLEKINHHGKRAGDIVKGMLQHSRTSNGVKEPTNINALADEYLRLAYHGLRAKDKSFNAKMKTDFDETIGKINVVPQDIGRVILNLITNAFYAVNIRQSTAVETRHALSLQYEPTVSISTKNDGNTISVSVKDNGNGIPQNVLDKIFQPFFTTKPTGEGTGLGLSMSYDIITKGHGGEFQVETVEGEGSVFTIHLPI